MNSYPSKGKWSLCSNTQYILRYPSVESRGGRTLLWKGWKKEQSVLFGFSTDYWNTARPFINQEHNITRLLKLSIVKSSSLFSKGKDWKGKGVCVCVITVKAKHGLISSLAKSNLYPTYKRTPEKKSVSLKKQAVEFPACLGFFSPSNSVSHSCLVWTKRANRHS